RSVDWPRARATSQPCTNVSVAARVANAAPGKSPNGTGTTRSMGPSARNASRIADELFSNSPTKSPDAKSGDSPDGCSPLIALPKKYWPPMTWLITSDSFHDLHGDCTVGCVGGSYL